MPLHVAQGGAVPPRPPKITAKTFGYNVPMLNPSRSLLISLCIGSAAFAQPGSLGLQGLTLEDIVNEIESAQTSLLIYSPEIRQPLIAEALRKAIVDRNLTVYLFTESKELTSASSYVLSLAFVGYRHPNEPNLKQRSFVYFPKVASKTEAFLLIDSQRMLVGNLIGRPVSLSEKGAVRIVTNPKTIFESYRWAATITQKATSFNPYRYLAKNIKKGKP